MKRGRFLIKNLSKMAKVGIILAAAEAFMYDIDCVQYNQK
jgi:hypothetical protein